jgi:hypothetical protein
MEGIIAGRTASAMPGLDIAEQRSWQNFLDSALRLYATLNKSLVEEHHLTLNDVRLLRRCSSPDDGRGVLAIVTDDGRTRLHEAMATYGSGVRAHFLGRLSRAQVAAMGENCRRIGAALKSEPTPARIGRV